MKCEKCNAEIPDDATFCHRCGSTQSINSVPAPCPAPEPATVTDAATAPQVQPAPKHRTAYIILGWYFGTLGVHNFYAGRVGCAVNQLLMSLLSCGFLTPVTWLWSFIEILAVRKSRGQRMTPATAWIVLLAIGLPLIVNSAILTLTVLPALNSARERSQSLRCINHLKQYSIYVTMYMDENRGAIPREDDLKRVRCQDGEPDWLKCPASEREYVILGAGTRPFSYHVSPSQVPVVIERPGAHKQKINVAFLDGHVETVDLPREDMSLREATEYILDRSYDIISDRIRNKWLEDAEMAE